MIFTLTLNPALDHELTAPSFTFNTVLHAVASRTDYGGKGFNVARALEALGVESTALGFVGGPTGARFAEGLGSAYIHTDFTSVRGETRTNVSIVDAAHTAYLKVNEPGPTISPTELYALFNKVQALAAPGDWWVLSGSLPPGVPPTIYKEMIEIVQGAGARVLLDASGAALRLGCEAQPFIVKPNRDEAEALTGRAIASVEDGVAAVKAIRGPQCVALSLGAAGALFWDGEQLWQAEAPEIEEHNPIGAGDAMVAGMLYALTAGEPPPAALRWGVGCGAAAAGLDGTAMGARDAVARLAEQVTVTQIL